MCIFGLASSGCNGGGHWSSQGLPGLSPVSDPVAFLFSSFSSLFICFSFLHQRFITNYLKKIHEKKIYKEKNGDDNIYREKKMWWFGRLKPLWAWI
jgi:hypothetical protein